MPESPRWGSEIVVTAVPAPPGSASPLAISKDDVLYANLYTLHQGIDHYHWAPMSWEGSKAVGHVRVPEGCEFGKLYLISNENYNIASKLILPLAPDGSPPPGAKIMQMDMTAYGRENWESNIENDLSRMSDPGWVYQYIWGLRVMAMRNLTTEGLLAEIEKAERDKESPGLLKSLVYGYFLAGEAKRGFEKLTRLCHSYPASPFSIEALGAAKYAVFSHGWKEYEDHIGQLRAYVANTAPENPGLRNDLNAVHYLSTCADIDFEKLEKTCALWMKDRPGNMDPYLVLASRMAEQEPLPLEAESLASKALEYSYGPMVYAERDYNRCLAYRTRSKIRARKKDWAGAFADIKAAQALAIAGRTEDLELEAELWIQLKCPHRAEDVALEAYRKGSVAAEGIVKKLYVSRTGREQGFGEYFISRLTADDKNASSAKRSSSDLPEAPAFKATTLDGKAVDSEKLKGEIIALNFWFINCGPCRGEMPELNKIADEFKGKVRFLAIANDPAEDLREFLKKNTFNYEIVPRADWVAGPESYPVEGFPTHYVIDQNGRIAFHAQGAIGVQNLRVVLQRLVRKGS